MTDEQWEELRPLAEADAEARAAFSAAQMMNTHSDPRKRLEQDACYERLRIEMQVAANALASACHRVLGPQQMRAEREAAE